MPGPLKITDLTPIDVARRLERGDIVLIDVREPAEYACGRIKGALNYPLSTFDPRALPFPSSKTIVLQCGSGKRSAAALERCQRAGLPIEHHLAGGMNAWRGAGLATTVFDPDGERDAS